MKKVIFLFILLNSINLLSQDRIDPTPLINKNSAGLSDVIDYNYKDKFVIGWNWGSEGRDIDNAMMINFIHDHV